jgi:hypothetical protein
MLCDVTGATQGTVDLLPSSSLPLWTSEQHQEAGKTTRESEDEEMASKGRRLGDEIYSFDGATTAIEVPAGKVNHSLGDHFTLSLWMKHDSPSSDEHEILNEAKEHIVCNADGDGELALRSRLGFGYRPWQ